MAKKSSRHVRHETNARAVLSLLILLLAFVILVVFYNNRETIIADGNFQQYVMFASLGLIFLVGLLFLINPQNRR